MRAILIGVFAIVSVIQPGPQTSLTTVRGTVMRLGSSAPLANVHVILSAGILVDSLPGEAGRFTDAMLSRYPLPNSGNTTASPTPGPFTTTTDSTGRFTFPNIAPGQYSILAQRDGFFSTEGTDIPTVGVTTRLTIVADQPPTPVSLSLTPGGIISGKVRNTNGDLFTRVTIAAYKVNYLEGRAVLISELTAVSDDHGEYRLSWLPPGQYYVASQLPRPPASDDGSQPRTFFPSTADSRLATLVAVNPGQETSGIDIHIQTPTNVKISGRIVDSNPDLRNVSLKATTYTLFSRDPDALLDNVSPPIQNRAQNPMAGEFEFRGILPGSYELVADESNSNSTGLARHPLRSGRTRVEVGNKDVTDIIVVLYPAQDVKGRVSVEGNTMPFSYSSVRMSLQDFHSVTVMGNYPVTVDASGAFAISQLPEGNYRFQGSLGIPSEAFGLPPAFYVSDIRQNGQSIYDSGLEIGPNPPDDVEVVLRQNGGSVNVSVVGADQRPYNGASIALVPQGIRRQNRPLYKATFGRVADDHFVFQDVTPGEYKVFAWESLPPFSAFQNAAILEKSETFGQILSVRPGISSEVQVRFIPK